MDSVACYMQFKICLNNTLLCNDVYKMCFVTLNSLSGWCNFVPEEWNIYMVENTPGVGCIDWCTLSIFCWWMQEMIHIYNEVIDIRSAVICLYDLWDDWVNISFFIFYFNSFIDRVEGGKGGGSLLLQGPNKHKIDEINDIERYIMLNRRGISPCWQIDRDNYKDLYICGWQNRDGVRLQTIPGWQKVFLNTILTFKISCLNKMFKISAAS